MTGQNRRHVVKLFGFHLSIAIRTLHEFHPKNVLNNCIYPRISIVVEKLLCNNFNYFPFWSSSRSVMKTFYNIYRIYRTRTFVISYVIYNGVQMYLHCSKVIFRPKSHTLGFCAFFECCSRTYGIIYLHNYYSWRLYVYTNPLSFNGKRRLFIQAAFG